MSRRRELAETCLTEIGAKINKENINLLEDLINDSIDEYWNIHYVHPQLKSCVLCGNTGIIDTTDTAIPPQGSPSIGGKHFCVCPNGQQLRKAGYDPSQSYKPKT